ncbi:hypothetical protein Tco_0429217 [Tanacetum coccineum]
MNEDYCEQNSCYDPNSFGFDQYQPSQFSVNYAPQETSREILQAQEDLIEAIQAFLKEYDHIPPNEKCMALLLAEERFLQIKPSYGESRINLYSFQLVFFMIADENARDKFLKDVCTFLRKFSRIPFGVTPKVILIAWESFGKIKDALTDKQYRQEDIQELISELLEDVRNIEEELSEYINYPSWNCPLFFDYDDDDYTIIYSKPKAITPNEPIEEPDNSLSMGDEHLDTIPVTESNKVIKSSVEILVPIPSELEGISDDTCGVPVCDDSSTFNALNDNSKILSDSNDDDTSSDDDDFEDVEYVSLEEESLKVNLLWIGVSDVSSPFPIPVADSDSFLEESDTSLSHLDNSLPKFETSSDHTEETRSGSTTTHANYSLPEYDSFLF